ncbi:O-methyltransferase [Cyclobacterium jeungdonense]|uniref:Class I SAM-dependent methyltransferase n=1 Tax=Cyclobacterium jeungdonense TaxID=708087 RepID=A0ABT8CBX3_9BACT|nr:class I SAM-dependent methyltransferase [Cyclobacterium jeungdonense]MDN3690005.1 class I SAM-dependent methyltransferase [Cyclobacterium jeungdonense]
MFFQAWEYFIYFLEKEDEHSLHSPFYFNTYLELKSYLKKNKRGIESLEKQRKFFLRQNTKIISDDLGAGSRWDSSSGRKVSTIMKRVGTPLKFSLVYQFLCKQTPANTVLDLGTSLGINTAYLSNGAKGILYSFEGDPAQMKLAKKHLDSHYNVRLVSGNLDDSLGEIVRQVDSIDFVLMDANHRYAPTIAYFEAISPKLHDSSIVVIADIHWSKEMKYAWNQLKKSPRVTGSMDFFECGVLFFRPNPEKTHLVMAI